MSFDGMDDYIDAGNINTSYNFATICTIINYTNLPANGYNTALDINNATNHSFLNI